ncbi:MAG: hypothetical protein A4E70_00181 [Syntrophus sp. PtaU1.Bin005]|uniref:hypothetical protein n=1 Tax=Syntrophus TaxID=43773 RepID=UPI0009C530B7|nr:MAG: hypothetical protein A4E69_03026 [Syntrophus sp. PtaB.Bin138]OPY83671.1 MAG: hypothetical protein A4E70_00181 [Syntrophus sp. PtaU1.Bin005]
MKGPKKEVEIASDPALEEGIRKSAEGGELSCAAAMQISAQFGETHGNLGQRLDAMKIRLVKCQLGLYGYKPEKKIVQPAAEVSAELEEEIRNAMKGNSLPCIEAWAIAKRRRIPKMAVSSACETLKIKISPCQLGAF